jgi:predicted nucleotidyltransferase
MTTRESRHYHAADAFAQQVRQQYDEIVDEVSLYGSVARGEERGVHSDVDLIVVLEQGAEKQGAEQALRKLAYDIELEFGVVLSLLILTSDEYHHGNKPYLQHVQQDAQSLYG